MTIMWIGLSPEIVLPSKTGLLAHSPEQPEIIIPTTDDEEDEETHESNIAPDAGPRIAKERGWKFEEKMVKEYLEALVMSRG